MKTLIYVHLFKIEVWQYSFDYQSIRFTELTPVSHQFTFWVQKWISNRIIKPVSQLFVTHRRCMRSHTSCDHWVFTYTVRLVLQVSKFFLPLYSLICLLILYLQLPLLSLLIFYNSPLTVVLLPPLSFRVRSKGVSLRLNCYNIPGFVEILLRS